jgi:hypothetical protein
LRQETAEGFLDHLRILADFKTFPRRVFARVEDISRSTNWAQSLLKFPDAALDRINFDNAKLEDSTKHPQDVRWFAEQARQRLHLFRQTVARVAPWMLPDFAELRQDPTLTFPPENVTLKDLPDLLAKLVVSLQGALDKIAVDQEQEKRRALLQRLSSLASGARMDSVRLIQQLQTLAANAGKLADEMEFGFLWNPRRKLLSIGFETEKGEIHSACYDLLASESRIATFVAIAKDEIPQETWFLLARTHTIDRGRPVLLSWTATPLFSPSRSSRPRSASLGEFRSPHTRHATVKEIINTMLSEFPTSRSTNRTSMRW